MSKDTWRKVEGLTDDGRPRKVRDTSYAKVDRALLWAVGSCLDILAGRDPVEADVSQSGIQRAQVSPADIEAEVSLSVETVSIRTTEMTAPQIRALAAGVVEDLRRRGII